MNTYSENDLNTMNCKQLFAEMMARQVYALMFHDEMSTYFGFLGLKGYSKMHEYQYLSESLVYRKIQEHFMKTHHEIVVSYPVNDPDAIPSEWLKHNQFDVTENIKMKAIKEGFEAYRGWEEGTVQTLSKIYKILCEKGNIVDAMFVKNIIEDVSEELKVVCEHIFDLNSVDYDMTYIVALQEELCEKYKECTMKLLEE